MSYNFKGVKTSTFQPLPEDRYNVVIEKAELTTTRESGNPMIKLTLKVIEGDFRNRFVWDNLVLTQSALWKTKGVLEAVGSDIVNKEDVTEDQIVNAMVGQKVNVLIEQRVSEGGTTTNSVRYYNEYATEAPAKKTSSLMG